VKPLTPGHYAVINLKGDKGISWSFEVVGEGLVPMDCKDEREDMKLLTH
jgi:hypothetical protein